MRGISTSPRSEGPCVGSWREMRPWVCLLGDRPLSLVAQAEVDQPAEVESAHAHREAELVAPHAPEAHPAMVVGHQPGDAALDHGPSLTVDGYEVAFLPGP